MTKDELIAELVKQQLAASKLLGGDGISSLSGKILLLFGVTNSLLSYINDKEIAAVVAKEILNFNHE